MSKELVTLKEALSQLTLQKEVLEDEKSSLAQALCRVLLYTFTHPPAYSIINLLIPSHSLTCSLINSLATAYSVHILYTHTFFLLTMSLTIISKHSIFSLGHSIDHTFIYSLPHSDTHLFTYCIYSLINPFFHSHIHSFIHLNSS